jgi:diketogulonate reductase-like aldo/keto reductase
MVEYQEKWKIMNHLDKSKIKTLGVSNFSLEQLKSLSPLPKAIQIEFAMLNQDMIDYCKNNNITIYVHSCIRKFKSNIHYENYQENLRKCKEWNVTPIIGAKNKDYMQINFDLIKS